MGQAPHELASGGGWTFTAGQLGISTVPDGASRKLLRCTGLDNASEYELTVHGEVTRSVSQQLNDYETNSPFSYALTLIHEGETTGEVMMDRVEAPLTGDAYTGFAEVKPSSVGEIRVRIHALCEIARNTARKCNLVLNPNFLIELSGPAITREGTVNSLFWIAVGFATVLVVFFMFAFFRQQEPSSGQHAILRFLGALCAGVSAAFLVGSLTITGKAPIAAADVAISGAGGFALFLIVWWGWRRAGASGNGVAYYVPDREHTFASVAEALAQQEGASVQFRSFSEEQKNTRLKKGLIMADTMTRALEVLGTRASDGFPSYKVERGESLYTLSIESDS
jgi:hypothetical protein